jgi:hypothetical protein
MPSKLLKRLGKKADKEMRRFDQLSHLSGTQSDKMRRIFVLGRSKLKDDCIKFGEEHMKQRGIVNCPAFKPVLILTAPGAQPQNPHLDQPGGRTGEDTYSVMAAVRIRQVYFKCRPSPISMQPGITVSWPAGGSRAMCHWGAGLGVHEEYSAGLHMFTGSGIDPKQLDGTWHCANATKANAPATSRTAAQPDPVFGFVRGVKPHHVHDPEA